MIFYIWAFFENVEKIKVSLKPDKNNGSFTRRHHIAEFFLEWEAFQTKVVEKIKKHFMFINFFPKIVSFMG